MDGERRREIGGVCGGGGGGGGGGFRYKPNPPLSAIDRFLWGQNKNNQNISKNENTTTILLKNKQTLKEFSLPSTNTSISSYNGSSFLGFSSWRPTSTTTTTTTTTSRNQDIMNLVGEPDYLFFDDENCASWLLNDTNLLSPNCLLSTQEDHSTDQAAMIKKGGKKNKVGCDNNSSILIIKGQWTEEEDRKLIKLVMQFGERKWAQIADKLDGRAGKQCRERWHNHLRPDIKKDGWSEEEERMLIEAHQIVGNRWAEIAKRIPGRTENSIKNHFNATKRRQNSRRKNKSRDVNQGGVKSQTTILQDYIRSTSTSSSSSKDLPVTLPTANIAATVSNDPTSDHQISLDHQSESITDDSPPLIPHTSYDDELHFIQNFFAPNNNNHPTTNYHPPPSCADNVVNSLASLNQINSTDDDVIPKNNGHLFSDTYLSYLFNGASNVNNNSTTTTATATTTTVDTSKYSSSTNSNENYYFDGEYDDYMSLDLVQEHYHHHQQKEMDLIEMVSYNSHLSSSQGSNNNNNYSNYYY